LAAEATVEKAVVGAPILCVAIVPLKLEKNVTMATKSTKTVVPMPARTHVAEMESARTANNVVTMQTPATTTPLSIRTQDAVMVLFNQERNVMMEMMTMKIVEATGNHSESFKTIV
jgi:hypothetical protein